MTEDEAFIRAVVDNPGDDTPRLVYADWLDDRHDPRGTYLRAEQEWAATHDPGDRESLWQMAKGLDPVWVARVSRPPVGVCVEHVEVLDRGEHLVEADIGDAERRIGGTFLPDYRAFLLNYNGGRVDASIYYDTPDGPRSAGERVWCLHTLRRVLDFLPSPARRVRRRRPHQHITEIAVAVREQASVGYGPHGNISLLVKGAGCGKVQLLDFSDWLQNREAEPRLIVTTLTDLLCSLPDYPR